VTIDIARGAFDWIASVAVDVDGGQAWCEAGSTPSDDLYVGTSGVLLGCAEALQAGLDTTRIAAKARDRLLHLADEPGSVNLPDDGSFSGWSGISMALRAWSRAAGDPAAADGAARISSQIAARVLQTPHDPDRYTDIISGEAGVLLALLPDGSAAALSAAHALSDRLVAAAEVWPDGLQWRMVAGWEFLMPGFSHGTAGVSYALATAGHALGRDDLIDTAIRGADTLFARGAQPEGWALPIAIPPRPHGPAVSFGWCHGPSGTARLFVRLHEIDPQPRWQHAVDACVQALRDSQIPARLYPGYWDNLGRCCGTAGVGRFLLDRYQATGDAEVLSLAETLAADVVARALPQPYGVAWSNTEHTRTPPELAAEPGFMQGAAGIGGWLACLGAVSAGGVSAAPDHTSREPSWV
jgi:lantibiotic modifying enzyme